MTKVYIPSENLMGTIVTEMTHGAKVCYYKAGHRREVWLSDEDYIVLEEMFFEHKEIE